MLLIDHFRLRSNELEVFRLCSFETKLYKCQMSSNDLQLQSLVIPVYINSSHNWIYTSQIRFCVG